MEAAERRFFWGGSEGLMGEEKWFWDNFSFGLRSC